MDLYPFKLDIDELINEFTKDNYTTLDDMKRVWLSRKFTFIYEARPSNNLGFFMQTLYAHSISHMVSTDSLSRRLGGLYCLYCLYETQPFKPPFKIYISIGDLRRLRNLVVDAKQNDIRVVPCLVKRMLERNMLLFGSVEMIDGSVTERINEITKLQDTSVQIAYEKLLANTRIEEFLNMDLGVELDVKGIKKMSTEYAKAKEQTFKGSLVGMEDIKHIAENKKLLGDAVEKIAEEWNVQKEVFYEQTGVHHPNEEAGPNEFDKELENLLTEQAWEVGNYSKQSTDL
ncbi:small nuclear RNA activating complex (SNAPc), subunit SNAP43 protein isoform X2 [Tasmannia lanceolata]|uniref:small nuclear RNA activating complex (SNAPc), subunit SNAP43 protein isoform X2 n=1 Tax=Tasmannia lanceolata TaxID=3420 RepID=UPI004063FA3A